MKKRSCILLLVICIVYLVGVVWGIIYVNMYHIRLGWHPISIGANEIIEHNLLILCVMFIGIATGGILSLGLLFTSSLALGITIGTFGLQGRLSSLLITLLPHGILEVGAFLLAAWSDLILIQHLFHRCMHVFDRNHPKSVEGYLTVRTAILMNVYAGGLLIVAGCIESTFTVWLVNQLLMK